MNNIYQSHNLNKHHLIIVPVCIALFVAITMSVQFITAYRTQARSINERMNLELEVAKEKLIFELYDMHDAIDELEEQIISQNGNTNSIIQKTRNIIARYPTISSCYVAFEPDIFPEYGKWYEPCSYRLNDSIYSAQFGSAERDYFKKDWYINGISSSVNGYWSAAYFDEELNTMICTHSVPLINNEKNVIGVVGIDITIDWAKKVLDNITPYDNAICALYSTDGTLLCPQELPEFNEQTHLITSCPLTLVEMRLTIAVDKKENMYNIWDNGIIMLITLLVGLLLLGIMLQRIVKNRNEYNRVESEKQLIDNELRIAHNIQMDILRHDFDVASINNDICLKAQLLPMREVGGDFYDFYRKDDYLLCIVGDVSGKGVPAAMFMSATVNLFRSAARRLSSPKEIMQEINSILADNNTSLTFVTAIICRLHIPTGMLQICNAGHNPPFCLYNTQAKMLNMIPNIPLGYEQSFNYEEQYMMLDNNTLILYTDGITEARNVKHEMLGKQRWAQMINSHANDNSDITANLMHSVLDYIGDANQNDDITLMTIAKQNEKQPYNLTIPAKIEYWDQLKQAFTIYLKCNNINSKIIRKIHLAIEEAIINIINYAYPDNKQGDISMNLLVEEHQLRITISDQGLPFDPTLQPDVDINVTTANRQTGGLGIMLIRNIMDSCEYKRTDNNNILTLIKKI